MLFGKVGNPDHDECIRMIQRSLDAGINYIDAADAYNHGESEEIVGKALEGRRDSVVIGTKVFHPMGDDPTVAAAPGAGSRAPLKTPCVACKPTISTCTSFIGPHRH
jgi:aryl-alcohol dehydrogenase-like predicted oxidoreductase